LPTVPNFARAGLNDSGEEGVTRIVHGGVVHLSRGQQTTRHAHYAWKLHVGLDAPVWLEDAERAIEPSAGARVLVIPPGVPHSTGAVGWSCAVFIAPGSRGSPWRSSGTAFGLGGAQARRLVDACQRLEALPRASTADFISELAALAGESLVGLRHMDRRAESALSQLRRAPDTPLAALAEDAEVSLDRLSRLITASTGLRLRQHVLWSRLLHLLSSNTAYPSITAAAMAAGFADHAHLTRTSRSFLGRAPSEVRGTPDAIEPW
jgi:AraC-like DNA-binding protein